MKKGDRVDIKQAVGPGKWMWKVGKKIQRGIICCVDEHCYEVDTDEGQTIRDVHEHFRPTTE